MHISKSNIAKIVNVEPLEELLDNFLVFNFRVKEVLKLLFTPRGQYSLLKM